MFQSILRFREKTQSFASRPEFRLAIRITFPVLLALLIVIAAFSALAVISDRSRVEQYFTRRISMLSGRGVDFARVLSTIPKAEMERLFQDRRFLPPNLRNFAVVFPDGDVTVIGPLESESVTSADFSGTELRSKTRRIGKEEYVLFPVRMQSWRIFVLYESKDALIGNRETLIAWLLLGSAVFSLLLFVISLRIARDVIRPIEELADRERAYARHIAHELKTPLAVAKSDIQLAMAMGGEDSESHMRSAISEIGAMRDTVDDLLLFSASGSIAKKESVDPLAILAPRISASGSPERFVITKDADASAVIEADPRLLATLLRNLVSNSVVHAPAGAEISVKFGSDGFVFSNPAPDADPKIVSKAFDAFVGTPGKGSWIGLSLVKRIAEAHGWKAFMELSDGAVRVWVRYPRTTKSA